MAPKADQAARRDDELQVHPAAPLVDQVDHPPLPRGELLREDPDELLGDVDEEALDRFEDLLALQSCVITWGLETMNSYPSRRIVSMRIAICSSPRPHTSKASARSVGFTRSDTFRRISRSSRSRIWREVR